MKIFLAYLAINSPQKFGYNYGLGYIASSLRNNGDQVRYFPLKDTKDLPDFYKNIKKDTPGIIGFSTTTSQFPYLKRIAKEQIQFCHDIFPMLLGLKHVPIGIIMKYGRVILPLFRLARLIETIIIGMVTLQNYKSLASKIKHKTR